MSESTHWLVECWCDDESQLKTCAEFRWPDGNIPEWMAEDDDYWRKRPAWWDSSSKWLRDAGHEPGIVAAKLWDKESTAKAQATHARKLGFTVRYTPLKLTPTQQCPSCGHTDKCIAGCGWINKT